MREVAMSGKKHGGAIFNRRNRDKMIRRQVEGKDLSELKVLIAELIEERNNVQDVLVAAGAYCKAHPGAKVTAQPTKKHKVVEISVGGQIHQLFPFEPT